MTTPSSPQSDPIVVALKHTEAELAEKLEEACVPDTREVAEESTAELAKLSDSLLAAARAAKDVVSLRKRRHQQRTGAQPAAGEAIREFTDSDGRAWRVWAVTPSQSRISRRESNLGEFEHGWLAFETLDEELRKRLPHYPADWRTLPEAKIQELLGLAVEAPTRRLEPRKPDPRIEPPPG
jgi:hypothetical protein